MSIIKKLIQLLLVGGVLASVQAKAQASYTITNYQPVFIPVHDATGRLQIVLRMFNQHNSLYALLVDPYTLHTSRCAFTELKQRKTLPQERGPGYFSWAELECTPYMRLIKYYTTPPYPLQNDGIRRALGRAKGVFLTVDMCPSAKSFEQAFFEKLVGLSSAQQPFAVGICISGLWMLGHPAEFAWLCQQAQQNKLNITWVNHTLSHIYYPDIPLANNFMRFSPIEMPANEQQLFTQERLQEEVLVTERLLLEQDQLPSIFFRFPGLITDQGLLARLATLGLIPLGTDAWLAKGEQPQPGSIILVHGNGNEPPGIKRIMKLLDDKSWTWLPLTYLGQVLD